MAHPLRVHRLDAWVDPADAFATLFGDDGVDAVWLDSGPDAVTGRSYIGTGTVTATADVPGGTVTLGGETRPGGILDALRDDLRERPHPDTTGYPLGWWGRLGYEAGATAAGAPVAAPDAAGVAPDAALLFVDRLIAFDHAAHTVDIVALDTTGVRADAREVRADAPADAPADARPAARAWVRTTASRLRTATGAAAAHEAAHPIPATPATWRHDAPAYLALIAACQDAIRAGDAYQLCLTNRATARTDADPLAVHLRLRRASPAPYAGFLRIGGDVLVSSSPEEFLRIDGRRIRTRPIKGTRPRGATVASDVELRAELEASEKERAENVMIVDLMRNDLGRVCVTGSVEVSHLLAVESYAQVHQLVSTVEGTLRPGLGAVDAVAACFPAGSMTGAPKLSAMRILNRLEGGPRGAFAGCFGYLGVDGSADLAMVIRSIHFSDGVVTIGAGGGITALSVPEEELEEVRVKAAAVLAAAGITP